MGLPKGLTCLALAVLAAAPALAQFEARATVTDGSGQQIGERRTYVNGPKVRVDEGEQGVILDVDAETVTTLDHRARTYEVSKLAGPAAAPTPLEQQFAAIARRMQDLGRGGRPLRVERGAGTRTLLGRNTVEMQLFRGDRKVLESWHAPDVSASSLAEAVFKAEAGLVMRGLADPDAQAERTRLLSGFPLLEKDLVTGTTVTVAEFKSKVPAADVFAPPAGYRRVGWQP